MSQRNSGYARVTLDQYETPAWVVECLVPYLPRRIGSIHDPAAGSGNIVNTLIAETGLRVTGDDITNGNDFLRDGAKREAIAMNPPFALAEEFIVHALEVADFIAALLRIDYDSARTRRHLFADCSRFAQKIILTKRIVWFERPGAAPSFNHMWAIWDAYHRGPPIVRYAP